MPRLIFSLFLAVLVAVPMSASAQQDVRIRFGESLRLDSSGLDVTADSLEVDQTNGSSIFNGNVLAVQGAMRIAAQNLRIEYEPGAREGTQRVSRLVAGGGVTMVTETEAIESREAVYSLSAQTLEMIGDVVFVQGNNMLSGQRFVADLRSGSGRMVGRVRTIIGTE